MTEWIFKFGSLTEIDLDCRKSFESKLMKEMAEKCGMNLCFSSPYHHSANIIMERQFRKVRDFMNTFVKDRSKNWAELLPEVEFALNATEQKTIGKIQDKPDTVVSEL